MSKEKIEILQKELEELSQQRKKVEAEDREREEREKPMREKWEREKLKLKELGHENSEASRKLETELEELRKSYLKEPEENLKKQEEAVKQAEKALEQAQEQVKKLSDNLKRYENLYKESQERLSAINKDLSDPMTSFLQTPEMRFGFDPENPFYPITPSQINTKFLIELASFNEYKKNLKKRAEGTLESIEHYKEKFEATKAELKKAKENVPPLELSLDKAKENVLPLKSSLESAKTAFTTTREYLKLEDQLQKVDIQKQELVTQKRELYSKMYERDLTTREKISKLEGERVKKENQLKIEKFKLELGKKLDFQKILAEEVSLATNDQEREELQQVQQSIEKRIKHLLKEISHYEQILTPQQEPSSSSSSSSDSSSSLSSSYSSSSSSSSESISLKISPSSLSTSDSSSSDSTTSETSPSFSSASPMDLISLVSSITSSSNGSATSEEVPTAGDVSQEGGDSTL